jgi:hypothetical protein
MDASGVPIDKSIGGVINWCQHCLEDERDTAIHIYLVRAGYGLEEDHGLKKAPGISADGGNESPDPGHVVGDTSPGHLIGPVRRVRRLAKDFGSAGAPTTGGMVSTPVAGSGIRSRRRRP